MPLSTKRWRALDTSAQPAGDNGIQSTNPGGRRNVSRPLSAVCSRLLNELLVQHVGRQARMTLGQQRHQRIRRTGQHARDMNLIANKQALNIDG